MEPREQQLDTLIVGGGMTGLIAARELSRTDRRVLVVDKGRGFGGRMAKRIIGQATFEHGAQFITAQHPRFQALVGDWVRAGVAEPWPGFAPDQTPRWRAKPDISAVAVHLAAGTEVWRQQQAVAVRIVNNRWQVDLADGRQLLAEQLILTAPVAQSLALLASGQVELPAEIRTSLATLKYQRCLTVMAVLKGSSQVPAPGIMEFQEGIVDRICDHQQQGTSAVPAVTIQAGHEFSRASWDRPREAVAAEILAAAQPWLGTAVVDFQIHGWRYSRPLITADKPCLVVQKDPLLILAGDAFGGPDLEGAAISGWAAAQSSL